MVDKGFGRASVLHGILQTSGYIASIIAIISAINTIAQLLIQSGIFQIAASISITVLMIMVTVFLLSTHGKQGYLHFLARFMNLTAIDSGYIFTKSIGIYEYTSRTTMKLTREYHIKVTKKSFNGFPLQYKWTGMKNVEAKCTEVGQTLEKRDEDYRDGQQHYYLKFSNNNTFRKGENVPKMGFIIKDMEDTNRKSLPYLSTGIQNPTDKLTLRVIFHHTLSPIHIRKLTYIHYTDTNHFTAERAELKRLDCTRDYIEWNIDYPIYGGKYVISWDFNEQ